MGGNCCNVDKRESELRSSPTLLDEDHAKPRKMSEVESQTCGSSIPEVKIFKVNRAPNNGKWAPASSLKLPDSSPINVNNSKRISDVHLTKKIKETTEEEKNDIMRKKYMEDGTRILLTETKTNDDIFRFGSNDLNLSPSHFRSEQKRMEDRYEILEIIGKGGFGEVSRIRDKATNEIKALKRLSKSQCNSEKEFSEEIKILQKLDHPNVIRFFEYYKDEESFYLVTE
jgi:hypothetical protein